MYWLAIPHVFLKNSLCIIRLLHNHWTSYQKFPAVLNKIFQLISEKMSEFYVSETLLFMERMMKSHCICSANLSLARFLAWFLSGLDACIPFTRGENIFPKAPPIVWPFVIYQNKAALTATGHADVQSFLLAKERRASTPDMWVIGSTIKLWIN